MYIRLCTVTLNKQYSMHGTTTRDPSLPLQLIKLVPPKKKILSQKVSLLSHIHAQTLRSFSSEHSQLLQKQTVVMAAATSTFAKAAAVAAV